MYDVFISYASEDKEIAKKLYEQLKKEKLRVWFDTTRLKPGYEWHLEIENACESSRILMPVLTSNWASSEWTRFETYGADKIIPIVVSGKFEDVATPPLRRYQADSKSLSDISGSGLRTLIESIREYLAVPPTDRLKRLQSLRYRHDPNIFLGREHDLIQLNEMLFTNPTTLLTQGSIILVYALGGVGKTTLARAYAEKYWRLYNEMYWVNCKAGMSAEYARLFDIIYLNDSNNLSIGVKAHRVLETLSAPTSDRRRLLILDDAVDENSISEWLPQTGSCHTIITSRDRYRSTGIEYFMIDVFAPDTSREFLKRRTGGRQLDETELLACDKLADKLGHLPLALEQAGAFIHKQGEGFTFTDYLTRFEEQTPYYLSIQSSKGSTSYPTSVYLTWRTTIDRLSLYAKTLLQIISFMSPLPLPLAYIMSSREIIESLAHYMTGPIGKEDNGRKTGQLGSNEELIRSWVDELSDYSLIRRGSGSGLNSHVLLQTVVRLSITDEEQTRWIESIINSLSQYMKGNAYNFESWPKWNAMLPHLKQVILNADLNEAIDVDTNLVLSMADYLRAVSQWDEAEPFARRALASREKNFGPDHPDTLLCVNTLGHLLLEKLQARKNDFGINLNDNCAQEVEKFLSRVYDTRKTATVPDKLGIAVSAINLAGLFQVLETHEARVKAENLLKEALAYMRDGIDEGNHYRLAVLNNLGVLLGDMKKPEEAIKYLSEAKEIYDRDHVVSDMSINTDTNLAANLVWANRLEEAVPLIKRAYMNAKQHLPEGQHYRLMAESQYNSIVGEVHLTNEEMIKYGRGMLAEKTSEFSLEVAVNLNNRAIELRKAGDLSKALEMSQLALQLDEKNLPLSAEKLPHRHNNLSLILYLYGDMKTAIAHNETAWRLNLCRANITSARALFLRMVFASIIRADFNTYIGQMKHLMNEGFKVTQSMASRWDISDLIKDIIPRIVNKRMQLLKSILAVLNCDEQIDVLEQVSVWSQQSPISSNICWPSLRPKSSVAVGNRENFLLESCKLDHRKNLCS